MSWQISCGFKNLDKLGVRIKKIKNTLLVGFFSNQSKSNIFTKEISRIFTGNSFVNFIPRREIRSISLGVQLVLFPFIVVRKSLEHFKILQGFSGF